MESQYVSVSEAARMLSRTTHTIYAAAKAGRFSLKREGRRVWLLRSDVEGYAAQSGWPKGRKRGESRWTSQPDQWVMYGTTYVSVRRAAEMLCVSPSAVYLAIREEKLRSNMWAGRVAILKSDVLRYRPVGGAGRPQRGPTKSRTAARPS